MKDLSPYTQAFILFQPKKPLFDILIALDLDLDTLLKYYYDYLRFSNMRNLVAIYHELGDEGFALFIHLFNRIKMEGLDEQVITDLVKDHNTVINLENRIIFYNNHLSDILKQKSQLEKEIEEMRWRRRSRMDDYDDGISPT